MGEHNLKLKPCLLALLCGGLVPVGLAAPAAAADPPGNNGTVKIDNVVFDDAPDNEPHDGCVFQVDFYGFDEGPDLEATVTFQLVPPTADDEVIEVADVFIGEDPAGGGTDLDASATYDLSDKLVGVDPHSQQGWHVKLTVHAEGSIGADTKFKVFWIEGCDTSTPPTSNPGNGGGNGNGNGGPTTTGMGPEGTTPTTAVSAGEELPATGTNTGPVALAGAALLGIGAGAVLLARRLKPGHLKSG